MQDYFFQIQKEFSKGAGLSLAKTFHLTLKFLGNVETEKIQKITDAISAIECKKFSVSLDSIGMFPDEKYIRVVWIGLKPEDEIIKLQKLIDGSLRSIFKPEKNFKPHITLARVKSIQNKLSFIDKLKNIKVENKEIHIKNFKLVKSASSPKGAIYEDLEVFEL